MASRWDAFIERYANEPFYWFQPKGFTIKPANLLSIREKLRLLRPFDGKPWHAVQKRYTDALRRKKLYADQTEPLAKQIEQQQRSVETLKTSLAALRLKHDEARAESKVLIARAQRAKAQRKVQKVVGSSLDTSAFDAFERMADRIDEREIEVAAAAEVHVDTVEQRFEDAETDADVEHELARLKEKLAQGPGEGEGEE